MEDAAPPPAAATAAVDDHTAEDVQDDRRRQIKDIMKEPGMSQVDKSRAIQQLMDGRRRSMTSSVQSTPTYASSVHSGGSQCPSGNYASTMARAAAQAHDYYSSDEEGDAIMDMDDDDDDDDDAAAVAPPAMGGGNGGGGNGGGVGPPGVGEDISYGYEYDRSDERSVASSVTHTSYHSCQSNNADEQQRRPSSSSQQQQQQQQQPQQNPSIPPGMYRQVHGRSYSLQDWTDVDRAAAAANCTSFIDNPAQISRLMERSRPNCEHYDRNCTIIAPCCGLAFGCRICHDECPALPKPLGLRHFGGGAGAGVGGCDHGQQDNNNNNNNNQHMLIERLDDMKPGQSKVERRRSMPLDFDDDDENHHNIDRFAIREVICRSCYTRQSSKTNNCITCGIVFGDYHCNLCNLWMNSSESPYHCLRCGFCRVGGRENFRHCDDCGMCIDALLFDDHNCKSGKYMSNCPVCQEDLFSSRDASHEMPCGHAIHWHCFKELTSYDTRCPVCKKTAETPEHMASTWSAIAMGIALQPVPPDMARLVTILCNDCERKDANRRWHFLGVRCMHCLSFNTNCEQIVMQGRDAATFLDELEASRSGEDGVPQDIAISSSPAAAASQDQVTGMDEDAPSAQETSSGSTEYSPRYSSRAM